MTKTKFKIDKRTGLPELPENQYWEVVETWEPRWFIAGLEDYEKIKIHEMRLYRDNTGRYKDVVKRRWWGKKYTESVLSEKPTRLCYEKIKTDEFGNITEELALNAALNIMKYRASKEKEKSLVGKYPPNKLDAGF